jgi:hypothetical protein
VQRLGHPEVDLAGVALEVAGLGHRVAVLQGDLDVAPLRVLDQRPELLEGLRGRSSRGRRPRKGLAARAARSGSTRRRASLRVLWRSAPRGRLRDPGDGKAGRCRNPPPSRAGPLASPPPLLPLRNLQAPRANGDGPPGRIVYTYLVGRPRSRSVWVGNRRNVKNDIHFCNKTPPQGHARAGRPHG